MRFSDIAIGTRSAVLVLGCFCALAVLARVYVLAQDVRKLKRLLEVPTWAAGSEEEAATKETQALIRQLAKESLPAAGIRLLDDRGYPMHLLSNPAGREPSDRDHLLVVLGSRRYSRVSALIAELPARQRGAAAQQAFASVQEVSRRFVATGMKARRTEDSPTEVEYVSILGCKWGLTAAFLMVARFGDLSMLCEDVKTVRAFNKQARQKLASFFADHVGIGPDIQGNALVIAMRQRARQAEVTRPTEPRKVDTEDPQRLADEAAALVAGLPRKMTAVYAWDAAITGSDVLHLRDRAPVSDLGETVAVYGSFSPALVDQLLALAQKADRR